MRLILLAATFIGAAAIGTAAPARPGGSGHGWNPPGAFSNGGGHHSAKRGHTRLGIGPIESDRRGGRRHGRFGRADFNFNPYAGAGIAGPIGAVDPHGNGFFTGGGGQIRLRGGRPYFDYDRTYPYEWSSARGRPEWDEAPSAAEPPGRCTMENGVRVCRGW